MRYIYIILVAICLTACNTRTSSTDNEAISDTINVVNIAGLYDVSKNQYLDDYVEDLEVHFLETKDSSTLSFIDEIAASSKYIYVRDSYKGGSVAIFNIDGTFHKRLPNGNAPSDIGRASSICYDQFADLFYVYDRANSKIMKFTSDGEFLSCHFLEEPVSGISVRGAQVLLAQIGVYNDEGMFTVILTDTAASNKVRFPLGRQYFSNEILSSFFYSTVDETIVNFPWSNKVFSYSDGVWHEYIIEDKNFFIDLSKFADSFELECNLEENQLVPLGVAFKSDDWWIYRFKGRSLALNMYRNVCSNQMWFAKPLPKSFINLLRIDGVQSSQDQKIIGIVDPEYMIEGSSNPDYRWDGSNPNNLISPEDMEKLKSVKPDDNPIIVLFKLKSDL